TASGFTAVPLYPSAGRPPSVVFVGPDCIDPPAWVNRFCICVVSSPVCWSMLLGVIEMFSGYWATVAKLAVSTPNASVHSAVPCDALFAPTCSGFHEPGYWNDTLCPVNV